MTLAAAVLLVAVGVFKFNRWFNSYKGQRELECLFGSDDGTRPRTCW